MRLLKQVVEIGNGAAVYVPKEYIGKEVIITLPENLEDIKKRILTSLIDYMPNILGVYLYGSYARGEQDKHSDIDVLIIIKEQDERIKQALKDIDVRVVQIDKLRKTIKEYPLFIIPILREAQTLINPSLLEELRKEKIDFTKFKWNFDEIKRTINIIEKFIEIDEKEISASHIYSLIMRIRVCYLIECILKYKNFSNEGVKQFLLKNNLDKEEIEKYIEVYRNIRDNKKLDIIITKEEISKLISILKSYSKKLEDETEKKIGKRN